MTDADSDNAATGGTEIVCFAVAAEPLKPCVTVRHNASYVTQLLANAGDLPNTPQRRRTDRVGPVAAYTCSSSRNGRTRRIV